MDLKDSKVGTGGGQKMGGESNEGKSVSGITFPKVAESPYATPEEARKARGENVPDNALDALIKAQKTAGVKTNVIDIRKV